ncbi:MAG TPA: YaaC family protein [Thermoanaerobaculia bacterium]|nr:YaaC family protein [Thermoanaerobaculia bacterium]
MSSSPSWTPEDSLSGLEAALRPKPPRHQLVFYGSDPWKLTETLFLHFENTKNLQSILATNVGFTPNETQATHISVCLRQGRELFRLARESELLARPLLIYYGMHSFAKAVALSFGNPKTHEDFPEAHGLKDTLQIHASELDRSTVKILNDGVFQRFVSALRETTGFQFPAPVASFTWAQVPSTEPSRLANLEISLKDLFARVPGLGDFLGLTLGGEQMIARAESRFDRLTSAPAKFHLLLYVRGPRVTADWARTLQPALRQWGVLREQPGEVIFDNTPPDWTYSQIEEETARVVRPVGSLLFPMEMTLGDEALIVGTLGGHTLPSMAIEYLAAFALGSIARYRPDLWADFVSLRSAKGHSGYRALVERFLDLIIERFPLKVLTTMTETRIVLRNPGVISG